MELEKNLKFILFHIPKTGGQSINKSFIKYLTYQEDLIHHSPRGDVKARRMNKLPWSQRPPKERDSAIFVMGHSVSKDTQLLFKTDQEAKHMVVFREPAKLLVSLFNFQYRHKRVAPPFDFWCTWLKLKGLKNWQATVFYRHFLKKGILSSYFINDFNYFKDILDSFWYVGAIERINEDFIELSKFMGILNFEMETINVGGVDDRKTHVHLTDRLREKLNKEHNLDYQLYQYALKRACPKLQ